MIKSSLPLEASGLIGAYARYVPTAEAPHHAPSRHRPAPLRIATPADGDVRIGIIHNARARLNVLRPLPAGIDGCEHAMPGSHAELDRALETFAANGVNALVIDGGDGTIRDVMSAALRHFTGVFPRVAVIPSGKTNALAVDLGLPLNWTVGEAVEAIRLGGIKERAPLEVWRPGDTETGLRGFIFGAGAFVRATGLAQTTHRFGAFNGLAVGLSIFGAVAQTVFGGRDNSWRQGERMRIAPLGEGAIDAAQYLLLGSTLTRMPLRIKPFGRSRGGLKLLRIDAQPRHILSALPALLSGRDEPFLAQNGYHRLDAEQVELTLAGDFILDGETFPGGTMTLRQGMPMRFVVP
ncbi:diacylglycerol/lipid kinase family protein [Sphingomonas hylomeconis]|uniref:Diacylglycerol/lipid kinase family protein n=1 Tax=Sphingomonas hylomeconis TaxID=1395958 RepID=A0ABV7SVA6_9SPHN|nr:acylglycerol kinase family protein [Sphingomonas hylomeconis]